MELFICTAAGLVIGGVLGFGIGREGFIEKTYWIGCIFDGNPPGDYKSWHHFVASKVKSGVTIKAS